MPRQVIVHSSTEAVDIIDTPLPVLKDHDVLIQVVVAASNPKDWKYPLWKAWPHNSGDDMAGIVHAVGSAVYEFKPGDRVAALHRAATENGCYAEYAVAPDWTTFHIPPSVSFEEAATLPVAALTAAVALFADMKLPLPFEPASVSGVVRGSAVDGVKTPLLIYGVSTAVGAFAAKLARIAGVGPIIGVAGRASDFAATLVDHVVDYRQGEDTLVSAVEAALSAEGINASTVPYIFDAISEADSLEATLRLIDRDSGVVSTVLPPALFARPGREYVYPPGVRGCNSGLPRVHDDSETPAAAAYRDFGYTWSRYLGRLLAEGRLSGHPYEVVPGGLDGVLKGLQSLKRGEASAVKYVYRIGETRSAGVDAATIAGLSLDGPSQAQMESNTHPLRNFPFPAS